jgi:hypothetical protein
LVLVIAVIPPDAIEDGVPPVVRLAGRWRAVLAVIGPLIVVRESEDLEVLHILFTGPSLLHVIQRFEEKIVQIGATF